MTDAAPIANPTGKSGRSKPPAARQRRTLFWAVPLLLLPLPLFLDQYKQYVANLILVYVPVAVGFNIVIGNLGLLAFSNVAFFGIGAYASGVLALKLGWPWWTTILPAGLMGALAGCTASVPALRGVRLFYLAIMTLAFGELLRWVYIRWVPVTGGSFGMSVPQPSVLGWTLSTEGQKFYVFLVLAVLAVVLTDRILRSRFGRAFMAIKDNELAAAAMGIPTDRYILLAFAWSGFVVGIGGSMYAALVGHVTPVAFDLTELILEFAVVMVGGLGSLVGSVVGAAVITAAPEFFRGLPGAQELLFGVLIVLVILFLPRGLASLLARLHPIFVDRHYRD
ncbi:MAG: branched-chain amino acid ABC transporter permease [Alphaproteobacteria bacterium]|nr:branched-chain amino acid ABC transporter permease [Alphaproteobacteria bacterium]